MELRFAHDVRAEATRAPITRQIKVLRDVIEAAKEEGRLDCYAPHTVVRKLTDGTPAFRHKEVKDALLKFGYRVSTVDSGLILISWAE